VQLWRQPEAHGRRGFTSLIGIDASQHRVDLVTRLFGIEALAAPFESCAVQQRRRQLVPLSIIYPHHAFEHTYHPDPLFAAASDLAALVTT
jgi:hypothetical protein